MQPARNHICYTYEVCRFGFNPSTPHSPLPGARSTASSSLFSAHLLSILYVCQSYCHLFFFFPSRHSRQKRHTDNDKSNCQWLVVLLLYIFCPSSVCASVRVCVWELSILCALPKSNCQLAQRFALPFATLSTSFGLFPASSWLLPFDFVRVLLLSRAACSCQLPLAASCCI